VYDEDDNLLTTIAKGPYPTTPLPHTPSQWTDPRPLAANATRTYVFKENILILGRQTVSCDNPNIDVVSNQNSGCTDAFGSTELTNIGCRTIQVVNSSGNVIKTAAPGEVFTLADGPLRVFLAGNDTLSVRNIVGTLTINSGGCEETTAPIFNDYPWLTDLVNPTGCSTEKVAVYQQGIYFFLLVTDASGDSKLYNQNGQFYCQHTATYDCVAAYNLGAPVDSWTCSDTPSGDCLTDEEMIQRLRASDFGEACPTTKITKIEYNGNTYYTYTIGSDPNSNTPCTLQDFGGATVDCKGESICVYSIFFDDPPICNELNNGVKTEIWSIDTTCSCTGEVDPVCGENGRTYINPCEARCAGVEVASQSPCVQNGGIRETITVCRGESVFLNAPPRVVGCLATLTPFSIAIEPTTGAVPRERDGFTITPTQSGTYSVTSVGVCNTNADVGMPGQGTIGAQNPLSLVDVFTTNIYEVIVEDCGNTPALFTDYPWLTDLINPNTCTRGRIELYQSGIYFYLRVNTGDGFAKLYNQNGQFYCQESANYNCVEAYRLGAPIDSWTCQGNVACPQVYIPVCGLDGRTYGSGCDANQQGVQVAYFGECNPATAPCEQYKGRVVTVGCGTYIQVPIQPTPPFGSSVNYFELSAFTDGILPVAGDSIKFSFLPTGIQNESCLSSLVPYVAGNMDCYEIIEQGNDCNQFRGTVLQNACGNLLLKVEEQRIFPTFASGVRPPRPGEIIEFNFNQAVETSVINCEGKTTQVLLGTVECFTVVDGIVCTQVPVCGVDGNTYGNACAAIIADVEIDPTGAACDPNRPCDFNYEGIVIVSDCDAQSSDPILQLEDGTNIAAAFSGSANFTGQAGDRLRVRMDIDIREDQMVNCAVPAVIGLITCFEVLEELPCGQYTGIYSLDECGNPLVRSTQSDGSTLLFAPAIPSAVILSDGAMIRFNILGEEESTLTCEGQERQVILGIASCVEIIEEMTNAICDDILVELVEDQFIISDNPNIPGSPELLMSGMLEFDNTDNSGGGFGIRLCNSLRCELPIALEAVNLEGSTVETYRLMLRTVNNESCRYTIENPEATESACNTTGTIFFDNCDNGQLYYFVITEDGKVYDPYFDRSITYTPVDGERVKFDFVDASFPSPCSIAEKAITITCLEVIERTPFEKYPFLVEAFNQYGCSTVEVFDQGSYDFIFLRQNANRGRLYLDNGTFYCETTPTYDCIAAYGLGSPTSTFNCNNLNTEESEERASTSSVQLNFTAFPNPTADRLTVQLPTASNREYQLYIHDMLGRRLYQSEVDQTAVSVELDMADYENGVYYIELRAAGMRGIKKVVKQGLE